MPMSWTTRVFRTSTLFFLLSLPMEGRADFSAGTIQRKIGSIKSADHAVIFARLRDGKVLFESNADSLLSPASATKILTSAVALSYFGPAFSFKTPVYYTGKIEKNKIRGDLFLKGNGDPFLVSEVIWQAAVDLKHLGIKEVTGSIVIDNSLFDDEIRDESRLESTQKSSHAYDAPVSAFAINFNTIAVATAPTVKGRPALAEVTPFPRSLSRETLCQTAVSRSLVVGRSARTRPFERFIVVLVIPQWRPLIILWVSLIKRGLKPLGVHVWVRRPKRLNYFMKSPALRCGGLRRD
jgi:D-alanyl-D-alanine carboxypeptidase